MATKTTVKKAAPKKAEAKAKTVKKAAVKPKEAVAKKAAAKPAAKSAVPKAAKSAMKKGTKYSCSACGLVVAVDTVCGCTEVCDIFCCEKPMKVKK